MGMPNSWVLTGKRLSRSIEDGLSDRSFDTLHDHAYNFLTFLQENQELFDEPSQRAFVEAKMGTEFSSIRNHVLRMVHQEIEQTGHITPTRVREHFRSIVTSRRASLSKRETITLVNGTALSSTKIESIREEYKPTISRTKKMIFEKLPLDSGISRKLNDIAVYILTKDNISVRTSGVVVAGYGKHEIFPALEEFHVDGVFSNTLKFSRRRSSAVSREETAAVIPFAQSEMVVAFMEGVDPEYQDHIDETVRTTLNTYSSTVLDLLTPRSTRTRSRYLREMTRANEELSQRFSSEMEKYRHEHFIQPVVSIVEELPKSELAAMAESLVNLTSFRRHVTPDAETVGGPIDVAVISRGDGFIWIKRKHYFRPELNQHFFANYYREVTDGRRTAK